MEDLEMIKTMQKKLQTEIKITTVIQHVFQVTVIYVKNSGGAHL